MCASLIRAESQCDTCGGYMYMCDEGPAGVDPFGACSRNTFCPPPLAPTATMCCILLGRLGLAGGLVYCTHEIWSTTATQTPPPPHGHLTPTTGPCAPAHTIHCAVHPYVRSTTSTLSCSCTHASARRDETCERHCQVVSTSLSCELGVCA